MLFAFSSIYSFISKVY